MEKATLFILNKTKAQQELLDRWIFSEWVSRILVSPVIGSSSINVKVFDETGRESDYIISESGARL